MQFELTAFEVLISSLYFIGTFVMAGVLAHWSGMGLYEIQRRIERFLRQYSPITETFPSGYPRPALARDLERFEGSISWKRALVLISINTVLLLLTAKWMSDLSSFVGTLAFIGSIEWYGIRLYVRRQASWYLDDMRLVARYYGATCRLVGTLWKSDIFPTKGRVVELRIIVENSQVMREGEYRLNVWVPPDLDDLLSIGIRTKLDVFAQPITVFLVNVEQDEVPAGVDWQLHSILSVILAPNDERNLRLIRGFTSPSLGNDWELRPV
ncbi:MAG: hypothetical protein E6Q53_02625 [Candidatus Moraniibacteriota bacterium]|nr:MAG: hypothetical protein E6Q53_02625 [Candidatus Moranbacteria bacterium]